ncbi:MAG: SPFH domain-containing protein [Lachnospiraceae bacterium]|jgi:regulator of protease activity HflC (stomatin/prohibitin superfamily)|nr:SPFH domain-containing protein [Lachnospiraceae bacterium]
MAVLMTDKTIVPGLGMAIIIITLIYCGLIGPLAFAGLRTLGPNEALVLTFFGRYYGTLRGAGFFFVNPFVTAVNPAADSSLATGTVGTPDKAVKVSSGSMHLEIGGVKSKKISLKAMTLSNDKQKINDQLGNPIIIGIVVIWKVTNTAKAVFNVDNYKEFLSIQCDSALRNIVRLYPYDCADGAGEKSLRGSSDEVSQRLKEEIQINAELAGLEIMEARITHLSYAQEIAAAMLQRQQASAIVDARQMIVDGAVGMVEMALSRLSDSNIVDLDEERKAAMVSNLLVVLCGNKDAQPIVNSGSLY